MNLLKLFPPMLFQESRHAHGMRCLGIPNTAHFANVTSIQDAMSCKCHCGIDGNGDNDSNGHHNDEDDDQKGNTCKMIVILTINFHKSPPH